MASSSRARRTDPSLLAGEYVLTPEIAVRIREAQGRLTLSMAGHRSLPLEPADGGAYRVAALDMAVAFRFGREAAPTGLTLRRYGLRVVAPRRDAARGQARQGSTLKAIEHLTPRLMVALNVPGVSIAGIHRCRVAWHREFGVCASGEPRPVERDTAFEACSMSKTPFAYVVLKLVEEGRLDLDKPLVEYLDRPYLADEPRHRKITARMVLTHTSGFPNWRKGGCPTNRFGTPSFTKPMAKGSYSADHEADRRFTIS